MPITKAIFCVAGMGTRFLPATKAQPKEMLPIVDKPIIQYLVEEAVEAGIEDIIFVTAMGKSAIENHFDKSGELEIALEKKGKLDILAEVEKITNLANFAYVRQPMQNGDGHALLCAEPFIDPTESVLVIFPDYLMRKENKTLTKMIEIYRQNRLPVIAADRVPENMVSQYGIMGVEETDTESVVKVNEFVEKPNQEDAPSNLINAGYYVITPEVMKNLKMSNSTGGDGEVRVADAFVKMTKENKDILALLPEKTGFDCGTKPGFVKATIFNALQRDDMKDEVLSYIKEVIEECKD